MLRILKSLFGGNRPSSAAKAAQDPQGFKSLPPSDSPQSYADCLTEILASYDGFSRSQIAGVLSHLPEMATGLHFGIHPEQGGEGGFSVLIDVQGPDSYVINKAVSDYRYLFTVKRVPGGLNVAVPFFYSDDVDFEVNDVIADTTMEWVTRLWGLVGRGYPSLEVLAFCEDDWGNPPAIWLQGEPA